LINVLLVALFTHPLVQLLSRNKFFASGHRFSGFDLSAREASYKGRGEFRISRELPESKVLKSSKEAQKRQTIAERKAMQGQEPHE
jgi:preprotein translocase subunit SecD